MQRKIAVDEDLSSSNTIAAGIYRWRRERVLYSSRLHWRSLIEGVISPLHS
jgi:hypothetical protein